MPTWSETQAYLRGKYLIASEDEGSLELLWELGTPPEQSLIQRTRVERRRAFKEPWLLIVGECCAESALDPREALRHNAKLGLATLALDGQGYIVRHAAPLETLSFADLDRALEFVALE